MNASNTTTHHYQTRPYEEFLIRESAVDRFLKLLGGLVALLLGIAIGCFAISNRGISELQPLFVMLLCLLMPISWSLMAYGQRMLARRAHTVVRKHREPPILYLRSFVADARWLRKPSDLLWMTIDPARLDSPEQSLTKALRGVGPMIALGSPGEKVPPSGAARLYVQNDKWQFVVRELANESQLIIFRTGKTDSFWWEVEHAARNCNPQSILFYLPPQDRTTIYTALRQRAKRVLPSPLPPDPGNAWFLGFDKNWMPVLYPRKGFRRRSRFRQFVSGSPAACIRDAVNEVLSASGRSTRNMRLAFREWLIMLVGVPIGIALLCLAPLEMLHRAHMRRMEAELRFQLQQAPIDIPGSPPTRSE